MHIRRDRVDAGLHDLRRACRISRARIAVGQFRVTAPVERERTHALVDPVAGECCVAALTILVGNGQILLRKRHRQPNRILIQPDLWRVVAAQQEHRIHQIRRPGVVELVVRFFAADLEHRADDLAAVFQTQTGFAGGIPAEIHRPLPLVVQQQVLDDHHRGTDDTVFLPRREQVVDSPGDRVAEWFLGPLEKPAALRVGNGPEDLVIGEGDRESPLVLHLVDVPVGVREREVDNPNVSADSIHILQTPQREGVVVTAGEQDRVGFARVENIVGIVVRREVLRPIRAPPVRLQRVQRQQGRDDPHDDGERLTRPRFFRQFRRQPDQPNAHHHAEDNEPRREEVITVAHLHVRVGCELIASEILCPIGEIHVQYKPHGAQQEQEEDHHPRR